MKMQIETSKNHEIKWKIFKTISWRKSIKSYGVDSNKYCCSYKLWPVWRMTSGAIQYGVPFIDLAPDTVAYKITQS